MSRTGDAYMEIAEKEYQAALEKQRDYFYQIYGYEPDNDDYEINPEDAYFYELEQKALNDRDSENSEVASTFNTEKVTTDIDDRPTNQKGWNEYNEEDDEERTPIEQVALDFVKSQAKLEILETSDWWLAIPLYRIEYQLTQFQQINLIEEYILRCIDDKELGLDTINAITDILKLDPVFVKYYLKKMLNNRQITQVVDSVGTAKFNITDEGKKTLETGKKQVAIRTEAVSMAYKPSLKIQLYNKSLQQAKDYLSENDKLCAYALPHADYDELTIEDVNDELIVKIAEAQGKEFAAAGQGSTVLKITSVKQDVVKYYHFGEVWIYNALNFKVTGQIWDFQHERWETNLEVILPEEKKNVLLEEYNKRVEETKQKQLKILLEKQKSNDKVKVIETLRGLDIRNAFLNSFNEANKELIIISPWINDYVVDAAMLKRFQNVVERGTALYIGWGIAKNIEEQDKKPSEQLMEQIKSIVNKNGYPGVYIFYIGNHHDKEVLVDEKYHMLGSFNWLSYRGEHNIRHESVNKIYDKGYVLSQRKILEEVFYEVLEQKLNSKECFEDLDSIYRWFGAVINLKEDKKSRTDLVEKAINELAITKPDLLNSVLTMYNKFGIKEFGYDSLKQKRDAFNEAEERKKEELKKSMVSRKELLNRLNCTSSELLTVCKMLNIKKLSSFSKEDAERIIESFKQIRK